MEKLRLDLETLEVERLDVTLTGGIGGLEAFGMGHASTELGQSCNSADPADTDSSCDESECDCDDCDG